MQGRFSAMKSFVDLAVTVLLFGLPQSFIYGINRLGVQRGRLMRWTLKYGVALFLFVLSLLLIAQSMGFPFVAFANHHPSAAIFIALSITGLVIHALLRGIFLTIDDGWLFSLITIQPALFLCVVSMVLLLVGQFNGPIAYASVGILSAATSIQLARRCLFENKGDPLPWKKLLANGSTVFVQSSIMAMQPFLAFSLLGFYGSGYNGIAFFSLALYVNQAVIVPLTMTAPLLFNRWSIASSGNHVADDLKKIFRPLPFIVVAIGIFSLVAPTVITFIFGQSYAQAIPAIQIMLLGLPFTYIAFIGMPALMSIGEFRSNSGVVILRLLIFIVLMFFFLDIYTTHGNPVTRAAIAWVISESLMGIMIMFMLAKHFSQKTGSSTVSSPEG